MSKIPLPEEIEAAKTPAGGFTRATLAEWGIPWPPPKGWLKNLEREARKREFRVAAGHEPRD